MTKYYIIQFSKDETKFRLVNKARIDGYSIGDRFLDGAHFDVLVDDDGNLSVKADIITKNYLDKCKASVSGWEKEILNFLLEDGYDNLQAAFEEASKKDDEWDRDMLVLTTDLSVFTDEGMKQV